MNGNLSLTEELQLLEKEYTVVAMITLASLKHSKVPTSHIYQHILDLPQQTIRSKYKKLVQKCAKSLTSATMEQVFLKLSPYCDFLNPDLLEHVVERFGDNTSCTIISMYLKRLKEFRRKTLLSDMTCKWVGLTPADYVEMRLEMDAEWKKKTLEDLEVFRSYPTRLQWFLKSVKREGFEVVFSVPSGVWLYQDDLRNLGKSGVVSVSEAGRRLVELRRETSEATRVPLSLQRSRSLGSDDQLNQPWEDMNFALQEEVHFGFHKQAGDNIFVSRSLHRAMRVDQAGRVGMVYTAKPFRGLSEFEVRLLDYTGRVGSSLKMGVMRRKVSQLDRKVSIPKLSEHRDNSCMWFKSMYKPKTEFQNNFGAVHVLRYYGCIDLCELKQDDRLGLQLSQEGELSFFVNGMSQGVAAHGVYDREYDVYGFLELVEGHKAVEITRAVIQDEDQEIVTESQISQISTCEEGT